MIAIEAFYRKLRTDTQQIETSQYADLIAQICRESLRLLNAEGEELLLASLVPQKIYIAFRRTITTGKNKDVVRISRPVNAALFIRDAGEFETALAHFLLGDYSSLGEPETTRLFYTMTMAFCVINDIHKLGDKKTPATFFELFISHLFARQFGVRPSRRVKVPASEGGSADLPTDIIFDLGKNKVKFHVPVKLSTRERVIQAWAHQRVLEGIWGIGGYKGLLVVLTETKLNLETREVVEICLPQQWAIYQKYIARLDRVYYLDIPPKYAELAKANPKIDVKSLGSLFFETEELIKH